MGVLYSKLKLVLFLILFASITSCGGSSFTTAEGGISGTGVSSGSVSGFSSVIVNGTALAIDAETQIFVDEKRAIETDLKVGYVIRVDADFNNNSASRIDYVETVRGPITTAPGVNPLVNPDTLVGSFDVLGQTILTNSLTIFDGIADVTSLAIGDVLDVSGVRNSSGAIIARYLQLKPLLPPVTEYRVVGVIANTTATTFTIGNLLVDYTTTPVDISKLTGLVRDGIEVRVKGSAASFNSPTPSIVADKVSDSVLNLDFQTGDSVELEGALTRPFTGLANMEVNGFPVDATDAVIEDGLVSDIVLDALLEVEGSVDRVDSANILVATKVKIIPLSSIRVEAKVDSVGVNSIVVLGKTFQLNERTQLVDNSDAQITKFSLSNLSQFDRVDIRGYIRASTFFLTRLVREKPDIDVRLQASVDAGGINVFARTISLLNILVSTDASTQFQDINDVDFPSGTEFFKNVSESNVVKARWRIFTDTMVPADDLSIEE